MKNKLLLSSWKGVVLEQDTAEAWVYNPTETGDRGTYQRGGSQVLEEEASLAFNDSYIYIKETEKELQL